ncbi:MAG: DUF2889 domain-containing protein [Rhodospirillaceae bacterium]|nr:DUF2889 domain-containing protein [Rhodospirillaceae bacterium]MBL6930939.1 DUF2889 domain-containing protein [Rhodospirillales bacterium]MBL6941499.1 DUF2889 domain-containing protein [Rhodospirillales bacterium]
MPLSKPNPRNKIHNREIHAQGFQRDDGLWDIESRLVDTKSYSFDNTERGTINSGEAIHDISIRLTLNDEMTVQSSEAVIDSGPFTMCGDITPAFDVLVGLSIKPGWRKGILQRLGGTKGCTHLVDMLLGPVAVTAWQTVNPARQKRNSPSSGSSKPPLLNSCHAFSASSPVVKREWPDFYDPEK